MNIAKIKKETMALLVAVLLAVAAAPGVVHATLIYNFEVGDLSLSMTLTGRQVAPGEFEYTYDFDEVTSTLGPVEISLWSITSIGLAYPKDEAGNALAPIRYEVPEQVYWDDTGADGRSITLYLWPYLELKQDLGPVTIAYSGDFSTQDIYVWGHRPGNTDGNDQDQLDGSIPEPASVLLLGLGMVVLGIFSSGRRKK